MQFAVAGLLPMRPSKACLASRRARQILEAAAFNLLQTDPAEQAIALDMYSFAYHLLCLPSVAPWFFLPFPFRTDSILSACIQHVAGTSMASTICCALC
jgi:hypothetical protein